MRQASGVKPLVLIPLSKASFNVIPGLHFNCSKKTIMTQLQGRTTFGIKSHTVSKHSNDNQRGQGSTDSHVVEL